MSLCVRGRQRLPPARLRGAFQSARALFVLGLSFWPGSSPVTGPPGRVDRRCGGSPAGGRTTRFPLAWRPEGSRVRGMDQALQDAFLFVVSAGAFSHLP